MTFLAHISPETNPKRSKLSVIFLSLGEAYGKEGLLSKCGACLKEAEQIYRIVPGEKHAFYCEVFRPLYNKYVTIATAVSRQREASIYL